MKNLNANAATTESPVKKTASRSKRTGKPICFTIMPYGGHFDDYYDALYCPAIEAAGLNPKRADDLYRPSTIVNDIWAYTQTAKLILADLTGKNPNVFYELGLAHALAKPAILVTESINDVPFDLRALRVLEYDKNEPNWGDSLRQNITRAIQEVIDSPLESVLPAFLSVKTSAKPKEITERDKAILELRRDFEILRHEFRRDPIGEPETIRSEVEARMLLDQYRAMGMSADLIEEKMIRKGVPLDWLRVQLRRIMVSHTRARKMRKKK